MTAMGYTALQTARVSLTSSDGSPLELELVEGEEITADIEASHGAHLVQVGLAEWDGVVPEGAFDPGEHNVKEVNAYLDEHPEEAAAVLAAEADGQDRAGITAGRHAKSTTTDGQEV